MTLFLQIFILIDVLLIGLIAPMIYRHARAHFKAEAQSEETLEDREIPVTPVPDAVKARMLKDSEARFEATIRQSIHGLEHELNLTNEDINNLIKRLATEVVNAELQRYREGLAKLHAQAEKDLGGFKQTMEGHEAEFKAQLAQEMKVEKERLIKQIDTKLGDAVGSFLLETLGHNVDLGSQSSYIMSALEEHKAEFVKEVKDTKEVADEHQAA